MSLRERFRGRRGGDQGIVPEAMIDDDASLGAESTWDSGLSGTVELTEFAPRQDGDYRCAERDLYLRFARPIVTETAGEHTEPARGEFTTAGRFTVQRPFGRPIVYTVLDDGNDAALVVRRTDTETREAQRLEFVFESDEA